MTLFRDKLLITLIIIPIFLIALSLLIICPLIQDIRILSDQIHRERVELERLYQEGQLLRKVRSDWEKIKPELTSLEGVLLKKDGELEFITTLENLGDQNEIKETIHLDPQDQIVRDKVRLLPLRLKLTGEFSKIFQYLNSLEKLDYYINISSLSFNREIKLEKPEVPPTRINVSLIAETYWQE